MKRITYTLTHNRNHKLLKDGTAAVVICAYLDKERKYFSTKLKIKPQHWDSKRRRVKASAKNYLQHNKYLDEILTNLESFELQRIADSGFTTLDDLVDFFNEKEDKYDFLAFFTKTAEKSTISKVTRQVYNSTYSHLVDFKRKVQFKDLDFKFIHNFECHLANKGLNYNTISKYLKTLKTVVNLAVNFSYIEYSKNPFLNYKMKSEPTSREYLLPDEVARIEDLEIPTRMKNLRIVRDMYLFSIYSGLRFSDIIRLSKDNIQEIDGNKFIVMKMEKTKEVLRIPIYLLFNGKPLDLLSQYSDTENKLFFADFSNQFVNRELKVIAEMANINKRVTFHTARHTTATFLLYKGVPITVVQKILGHTKITTTQIYAKTMDMTMERELSKVFCQ